MFLAFVAAHTAIPDFIERLNRARSDPAAEKVNTYVITTIALEASMEDVCERHLHDLEATPKDELDPLSGRVQRRTFIDEWADARKLSEGERTILAVACGSYMDGRQREDREAR